LDRQNKNQKWHEQISTEINSLKKVRHEYIIKLLAFNLSAKYPKSNGGTIKTILLVLEYCPGGELFDLLFYSDRLNEITVRTYFHQLMNGLKAIHLAGIAHRDIKPQNILLDADYCIKITDFGWSKIFETEQDRIMKTTYVGTRGFQAPELLKHLQYTNACDIFSCAVVLFVMVAGYPPFLAAHKTDKWYKLIAVNDMEKFWYKHRKAKLSEDVKELLTQMFCYKPSNRATLDDIFKSKWFQGPVLQNDQLKSSVMEGVRQAKEKRSNDPEWSKATRQASHIKVRALKEYNPKFEAMPAKPFPGGIELVGLKTFYTTIVPYNAILYIHYVLTNSKLIGHSTYDPTKCPHSFNCVSKIKEANYDFSISAYRDPKGINTLIHFQTIQIPDSLTWARLYREMLNVLSQYDILLDDLPIIARESKDVEEEEKQSVKHLSTEHVTLKPVIANTPEAKPAT